MTFDPISYYLAKKSATWKEIKQKLQEEGSLNKQYDSNLDGLVDKLISKIPLFGDGTIDMTLTNATLDLSGKVLCYKNLTLNSSIIECTSDIFMCLFVKEKLLIDENSIIRADGCGAPGGAGGVTNPSDAVGTARKGVQGVAGVYSTGSGGSGGSGGTSTVHNGSNGLEYRAGGGGAATYEPFASTWYAGAAGAAGVNSLRDDNNLIKLFLINHLYSGEYITCGGSGGGSGAQNGGHYYAGGAGGAAGGVILIFANEIVNNGLISAKGANGANGVVNGGGGGGGDGGIVYILCNKYSGTGSIDVSGGSGGIGTTYYAKSGDGAKGADGIIVILTP